MTIFGPLWAPVHSSPKKGERGPAARGRRPCIRSMWHARPDRSAHTNRRRLDTPGHDAALLTQASFGWALVLFVRALMRAFMCGALSMLQFIGLDSRHLASIDESIDA